MSENILDAQVRQVSGKGGARQLRLKGMVPGVFYGHNETNIHFTVSDYDLGRMLRHRHTTLMLNIGGGEPRQCVIRSIQRDPIDSKPLHIDLLAIHKGELISVTVPVKLIGTAVGVKDGGGVLEHSFNELSIECDPMNIPEFIEIDVSGLQLGDSIHIGDLNMPNISFLDDEHAMVAHVVAPKAEKAPTGDTEAAVTTA